MSSWYTRKFARIFSFERILWSTLIVSGVFLFIRYKTVPALPQDNIVVIDSFGTAHRLSELTSGTTVVHFYASWCGPCLRELPEIKTFMETPLGKELNFVFITEDNDNLVRTFQERYGFKIYRVNKLKDAGVYSIPLTYLLNEQHEIVKSELGNWEWNNENFKNEISTLIKK